MPDAARLKRGILSLTGPQFRIGWLRDHVTKLPPKAAAEELNALCEEGERSVQDAREALLTVAMLLAELGDSEWVNRLRTAARAAQLLSLERLLRRAPPPPILERDYEDLPIPDYGTGRELTVGERRSLARRPNRSSFEKLLVDPHPLVLGQLMLNPKLTENDVVYLITRRPARLEALKAVVAAPRWLSRTRVRMALLLNPGTPSSMSVPLLILCTRQELKEITAATDASRVLRVVAQELIERRPPLPEVDPAERPLQ